MADTDLVLIGYIQKAFGLVGEVKVKPETFDLKRHGALEYVKVKLQGKDEIVPLKVLGSRDDGEHWFLKFSGLKTPEATAFLSGAELFVEAKDRLDLPENMVYFSDMIGLTVIDETAVAVGPITEVIDQAVQQLLRVDRDGKELLIPWNDHFIKRIDLEKKEVHADLSPLRGVLI